ncbi:hypothetical protein HHI36_007531 [Cryptolaemus montrouzieri]|uniref:Uncharacterized protein n=1 Tax=Cryptolaemus montrouzieri TaxID=559131 RepID=A0ABD2MQ07_9CUCU
MQRCFRGNCIKLGGNEEPVIGQTIKPRLLFFFCDNCKSAIKKFPFIISRLDSLIDGVNSIKNRVEDFESNFNSLSGLCEDDKVLQARVNELHDSTAELRVSSDVEPLRAAIEELKSEQIVAESPDNISEMALNEMSDRLSGAKCFMVFNLMESSATNLEDKIDTDKKALKKLFDDMYDRIEKVVRVGKRGPKPRPLRVVAVSADVVERVMRGKPFLRNSDLHVDRDLSVKQRQQKNETLIELNQRKQNGENIGLKYSEEVPRIVQLKN